jgi:hypothetical protein
MTDSASLDPLLRDAAFALALSGGGPGPLFQLDDATAVTQLAADGAPREACFAAVQAVRALCAAAIEVADQERGGVFGDETSSGAAAHAELERRVPGFTAAQYGAAFALGLWFTR